MRLRTFIMKDAYSFDIDEAGLDRSFEDQREAYKRIFTRAGIKFTIVEASSGAMGGSASNEFVARTDAGEDLIATCANCGYAANLEKATSRAGGNQRRRRARIPLLNFPRRACEQSKT